MLLLLVMLAGADACLHGFAGDPCERCAADFACDENGTHVCANRTHSMNGSRACDIAEQPLVATSTRRVAVKRWWAHTRPNPSNASCGCYIMTNDVFVILDTGSPILVGGVDMKGRDEAWVKSFQCSWSNDNVTWAPLGGVYQGNVENKKVVSVLFPYATMARFVKIHVVEYFKWPSFRAALLEALATTCPVGRMCKDGMVLQPTTTTPEPTTPEPTTTTPEPTTTTPEPTTTTPEPTTTTPEPTTTTPEPTTPEPTTPEPTTTTPQPTTTTPTTPTTTPQPTCQRRPNMRLVNSTHCDYACKAFTFGPHCIPHAKLSGHAPGVLLTIVRQRPAPIATRLHAFGNQWALEFPSWHGTDLSVQTDGGAWMAWNRKPWDPAEKFHSNSTWLLLPQPVAVRVRVRVLWQNTRLVVVSAAAATKHGSTASLHLPSQLRIQASWGLGPSATHGDSQALCSISTDKPAVRNQVLVKAFQTYNDAKTWAASLPPSSTNHAVFEAASACANVSYGLQWLRRNTELYGVDTRLVDFIKCGQNAWLVPEVSRTQTWHVAVVLRFRES